MRSIETSGKTVEDAIQAGLKELGCDITDVTYEVLDQGKPGLFGMFGRLAKIRMSKRAEEADDFAERPPYCDSGNSLLRRCPPLPCR